VAFLQRRREIKPLPLFLGVSPKGSTLSMGRPFLTKTLLLHHCLVTFSCAHTFLPFLYFFFHRLLKRKPCCMYKFLFHYVIVIPHYFYRFCVVLDERILFFFTLSLILLKTILSMFFLRRSVFFENCFYFHVRDKNMRNASAPHVVSATPIFIRKIFHRNRTRLFFTFFVSFGEFCHLLPPHLL